jgi:MFS family permease
VADVAPPPERPRLYGLLGAAFGVGFVLGPALGGLSALAGARVPFVVAGVLALANALAALRRLPETHPSIRRVGPGTLRRIPGPTEENEVGVGWSDAEGELRPTSGGLLGATWAAGLLRFAVIGFVATAAFAGFEATFSLFGQRRFDLTEGSIAAVFVLVGILLVTVQGALVRPVTARFGLPTTLRLGLASTSAGLVVLAPARTWPVLLVALVLLVLGQGLTSPTLTSSVSERAPEAQRGQLLGVQQSAGALARIVGPAAAGVLFQHLGVGAPALVGAAVTGVALVLATTVRPIAARPTTPAPAPSRS